MPTDQNIIKVSINDIITSEVQPRKVFDEESIKELALSIKTYGILNPLIVRKKNDKYELVAGERRYRAAKMLGLQEVPVIIKELTDNEALEIALIDNIQRNNLNPIEEAESYKEILNLNNLTQEELSNKIGRNQSTISNKLRLLNLSDEVRESILNGKISERHGRALLKLDIENQNIILQEIINKKLSVKETEELINQKSDKQNILDVLNSVDIDNKDSNVFKDVEKEVIEIGDDNMNNNIGMGNFFPQINTPGQTSENNTIMFNNSPMNANIETIDTQNNMNSVPLSTLSQEPTISTINTPTPGKINVTQEIIPSAPVIPEAPLPNININSPIKLDTIPSSEPVEVPNIGIDIKTSDTVIPEVNVQTPEINIAPMTEPPLFNANLSSTPVETTVSVEPEVNVSISSPIEVAPPVSNSIDQIRNMLQNLNDPKVSFKEYNNSEEKCIIISIKE